MIEIPENFVGENYNFIVNDGNKWFVIDQDEKTFVLTNSVQKVELVKLKDENGKYSFSPFLKDNFKNVFIHGWDIKNDHFEIVSLEFDPERDDELFNKFISQLKKTSFTPHQIRMSCRKLGYEDRLNIVINMDPQITTLWYEVQEVSLVNPILQYCLKLSGFTNKQITDIIINIEEQP